MLLILHYFLYGGSQFIFLHVNLLHVCVLSSLSYFIAASVKLYRVCTKMDGVRVVQTVVITINCFDVIRS